MAKPTGPTIARWQLGAQLAELRERLSLSYADVAAALACSESKIRKIEAGYVGVNRAELMVMLTMYNINDEMAREELWGLAQEGKKRGWWSKIVSGVPGDLATFLNLESAATMIRNYEPLVVPGLLQTAAYARAIAETSTLGMSEDEVERQVTLRMARQKKVLGEDPPELWVVLDEAALHRVFGSPQVMKEQLLYLVEASRHATIQIIPFSHGGHPGTLGSFVICEFEENVHSPVVYVESQAGSLYLEKEEEVRRCSLVYNQLTVAALSRPKSRELIEAAAGRL